MADLHTPIFASVALHYDDGFTETQPLEAFRGRALMEGEHEE